VSLDGKQVAASGAGAPLALAGARDRARLLESTGIDRNVVGSVAISPARAGEFCACSDMPICFMTC
jgi:hypothetical protein